MTLPAVRDEVGLQMTGKEVILSATEWANALMAVVEDRKLYVLIGKKKHLVAEAWETIGAFDRVAVTVEYVKPIQGSDDVIGYEAKVNLLKDGEIISAGVMSCGFEEFPCRAKKGMAQHRAAMSAAQTWAMAKAYRMKYSYVAVLAGFDATPAEEMQQDKPAAAPAKPAQLPAQRKSGFGQLIDESGNGRASPDAPAPADAGPEDAVTPVFKNLGEFYTAVHERWDKAPNDIRKALGMGPTDEIVSHMTLVEAWAKLGEKWE